MISRRGRLGSAAALALLAGCADPNETAYDCPAWTDPEPHGCVLRPWTLDDGPSAPPGASDVQVALGPDAMASLAWTADTIVVAAAQGPQPQWTLSSHHAGTGAAVEPAIAIGPDGNSVLAWKQQAAEGSVYVATQSPGEPWNDQAAPVSWPGNAYEPRVVIGDDGEALLVWNQWAGDVFGVAVGRRAPGASNFVWPEDPAQLRSPPENYSNAPRIALAPGGEALIAWYQAPVDDLMVFASERRHPDDSFSRPAGDAFVSPLGGAVDSHAEANPQPAVTSTGEAAIAWTQRRGDASPVYVAQRDAAGQWTVPRDLDDTLSVADRIARCPSIAFDHLGGLWVVWFEQLGESQLVVAAHQPAGGSWTLETLSPFGAVALNPALAMSPREGPLVVWAERRNGGWWVRARRHVLADARWLPAEALSQPTPGLAPRPRIAAASDGRVRTAWAEGPVTAGRLVTAGLNGPVD